MAAKAPYPHHIRLPGRQARGIFKARLNRFAALVEFGGGTIKAHVPNSGRLAELLIPGSPVLLTPRDGRARKTAYDLSFVPVPRDQGDGWVCIDSRVPNQLLGEISLGEENPVFPGHVLIRREPALGESRLDFLLAGREGPLYVETKCVTLVTGGGRACFPDAPTDRGRRHLEELARLVRGGGRGAVLFLVQRADAAVFSPHDVMDPPFGRALRQARESGVLILAWNCIVDPGRVFLGRRIPVLLQPPENLDFH